MNQVIFVCLFCSFCCYIDTKIRNSGSPTSSGPLNFFFLREDYFMNVLIQSTQLAIFLVKMRWIERKKNPGMDEGQDTSFKGLLSYPCSTCTAEKAPVNTVSVRGCQVAKPQWWQHLRKFRMRLGLHDCSELKRLWQLPLLDWVGATRLRAWASGGPMTRHVPVELTACWNGAVVNSVAAPFAKGIHIMIERI